jgi:hypothetical protein
MKHITEFIEESMNNEIEENKQDDTVYALIDNDLEGAIMDVFDLEDDAKTKKEERLKENSDLNLDIKPMKRSEVEKQ